MKWIEHTQTTFGPFWLGLRADTQDGTRNLFEWEHPLGKEIKFINLSNMLIVSLNSFTKEFNI